MFVFNLFNKNGKYYLLSRGNVFPDLKTHQVAEDGKASVI